MSGVSQGIQRSSGQAPTKLFAPIEQMTKLLVNNPPASSNFYPASTCPPA